MTETTTCPWCGQTEVNEWLLGANHWVKPAGHLGFDWCQAHGMCIAMELTRNHVLYAARLIADPTAIDPEVGCCHRHRRVDRDCLRDQLRRYLARARQVWPIPRQHWIGEYDALLAAPTVPEHHHVPESEQADLFGEAS